MTKISANLFIQIFCAFYSNFGELSKFQPTKNFRPTVLNQIFNKGMRLLIITTIWTPLPLVLVRVFLGCGRSITPWCCKQWGCRHGILETWLRGGYVTPRFYIRNWLEFLTLFSRNSWLYTPEILDFILQKFLSTKERAGIILYDRIRGKCWGVRRIN